jgi:hypothetical protein
MMDTIKVYWLAFKYWAGGTSWDEAFETAAQLVVAGWEVD